MVGQFRLYSHRKLLLEHAVVASFFSHKTVVDDIARRDAVFMLPRLHKDIYNYIYPYILQTGFLSCKEGVLLYPGTVDVPRV
jgi:hypothetical protein